MRAMPIVPRMKAKGDDTPAWVPMSAVMKITPMVGEMKASDMARALGRPRALRFSSLVWVLEVAAVLLMHSSFIRCSFQRPRRGLVRSFQRAGRGYATKRR